MNDFILIKVSNNIKRFLDKCKKYNIDLHNIFYLSNDEIVVKILKSDFKNIKRYNYYSEITIYKYLGKDSIIEKINNLKYFIITFLLCIIGMYFISNVILKINVIHSNKNIRELVYNELASNGIKRFSYKKDFKELENIKDKILENNKDNLEWLSITNVGMTYVIRVEERLKSKIKVTDEYCNLISKKDALITNIYATSGEVLVNINDYVRKGDILVSGDIYLNEESKGYTCASGIVYGNVWYNTSITVNRNYFKKKYTNKKRFNFTFKNKILRKNMYTKYDKEYIIKNKFFSIYKEKEYKLIPLKYNERDSEVLALKELKNKFKTKLGSSGKVEKTRVLNKEINEDSITIKVFVITNEIISDNVTLEKEIIDEEKIDIQK